FGISGDVPTGMLPGFGAGIHLRKAITYALSIRIDGFYGITKGFDDRFSDANVINLEQFEAPAGLRTGMYRNYQSTNYYGAVEAILNIGNILFHKERNKWNTYVGVGIALAGFDTKTSYVNANPWTDLNISTGDKYKDN